MSGTIGIDGIFDWLYPCCGLFYPATLVWLQLMKHDKSGMVAEEPELMDKPTSLLLVLLPCEFGWLVVKGGCTAATDSLWDGYHAIWRVPTRQSAFFDSSYVFIA